MNIIENTIPLQINKLRSVVFGNYADFIKYAKQVFRGKRVSYEEIVNESIVAIFSVNTVFYTTDDVIKFIHVTIKRVGCNEIELTKDKRFIAQLHHNDDITEIILNKEVYVDAPSDEFIEIYNLFEKLRFGENLSNLICFNCGSKKLTQHPVILKFTCNICRTDTYLTGGTYLNKRRTSLIKIYKIINKICASTEITAMEISKSFKLTYKCAWKYTRLICCAITQVGADPYLVLEKLLIPIKLDDNPIEIKNQTHVLTADDVRFIRDMYNGGIMNTKQLAQKFSIDYSNVRKTIKGKIHKSVI